MISKEGLTLGGWHWFLHWKLEEANSTGWMGLAGRTLLSHQWSRIKNSGCPPHLSRHSHTGACEHCWASFNHRNHNSDQTDNAFKFLLNKIGKSCREHLAMMPYVCLCGKLLYLYHHTFCVWWVRREKWKLCQSFYSECFSKSQTYMCEW